jgi:membrane-bound lytic murein transglycosylase MltF
MSTPRVFWLLLAAALIGCTLLAGLAHAAEPVLLERFDELRATDDLDGMVKRRFVRALVVYSRTFYFVDNGRERGLIAEGMQRFEQHLNKALHNRTPQSYVRVVAVPVSRDQLLPALLDGRGDIAMANLTITPQREAQVAFSAPFYENASEILVTAPGVAPPANVEGLSGQDVFVRRSSSYHESLERLNADLAGRLPPVNVQPVDDRLEDEDLLELVDAGVVPRIVMDDYKARFWSRMYPGVRLNHDIALNHGGRIAWAMRKDSPKFKRVVDGFVERHKFGTALYNDAYRRYFRSTRWVKNPASAQERLRYLSAAQLFQKYGTKYDFDPLMLAAQGYQESGLDQHKASPRGAIGVMQLMPDTGAQMDVGDIRWLEPNIHAGIKYLRLLADRHFPADEIDPFNRTLFALAAYNAGPGRVAGLRREAQRRGLDPNRWFNNVEQVAARRIGRETVQYVANIYRYYVSYSLLERHLRARADVLNGTP